MARPRKKKAGTLATKESILKEASFLFQKYGFHQTSFKMIADRVGIQQPAIYAYFKDMEDILLQVSVACAQMGRAYIDSYIDQKTSAKKQFAAYIEGNLEWTASKPQEAYIILTLYYLSYAAPKAKMLHESINKLALERIGIHLLQGQREGLWTLKSPTEMSLHVHNLLTGEMIKILLWPKQYNAQVRAQGLIKSIEVLLKSSLI